MIRKVSGGYRVYSERGKPLSKTYPNRKGAEKIKSNTLFPK